MRDPHGFRPLVLGRLPLTDPADGPGPGLWGDDERVGWVLASETAALDIVGAEFVRDVEPGEIVILEQGQRAAVRPLRDGRSRRCASSS